MDSNKSKINIKNENQIVCDDESCEGFYQGKEFIGGSDIAHQFSNKMSAAVGDKLKNLYSKKLYSKVNFDKIEMSTIGMGTGNVAYKLKIPFTRVQSKCDSYTQWKLVWDSLCEYILVGIKAKNAADALASASIFNADSGQKK